MFSLIFYPRWEVYSTIAPLKMKVVMTLFIKNLKYPQFIQKDLKITFMSFKKAYREMKKFYDFPLIQNFLLPPP